MALDVYLLGLSIANNHPDERLNTVFKRSKHSGTGCQDDVTTSPDAPILCAADLTETCLMLHRSVISLTSVVADLQQEVKELRSKLTSNPGLKDNHDKPVKQNHNNKLLQPSSNTQDSDAEVTTENDFHLSKRQQRKLKNGSQTIPNSFPGIKGESASGHSFRAASTIPLLRPVFIGNAHHETTEDDIRKHVTSIGLADGLSDVQTLPSTIAGRAAFCVTFNDDITEEKAYKCDWPNRVIVRPYRPPRKKNIHEPGSNGQYNHGNRQGNGNKMALRRDNNNKRYNNNHGHYNNHNNNHNNNSNNNRSYSNNSSSNNNNKRYNQYDTYNNNNNIGRNNNTTTNNNNNNSNSNDGTYRYPRSYNHPRQIPSLPQWQPFYTGYNGQFMPLMNLPPTI